MVSPLTRWRFWTVSKVRFALIGLTLTALSASPLTAYAVKGPEQVDTTSQQLFVESEVPLTTERTEASIVITDRTGVKVLEARPGVKISKALLQAGYRLEDFRTEHQHKLEDRALTAETVFLFKVEYSGSSTRISIPAPVTEIRTNAFPEGTTMVQEEGASGLGILTTVVSEDLSHNQKLNEKAAEDSKAIRTETLTVVSPPVARIVMVGTADEVTEPVDYTMPKGECTNGTSVPDTVVPELIALHEAVCIKFPEVTTYGTYRDHCTYSCDHRDGKAVDIMVEGELGWRISNFLIATAEDFNINYLIYEQQIWTTDQPYWRPMEDRGSVTANHFDHVHVSFN